MGSLCSCFTRNKDEENEADALLRDPTTNGDYYGSDISANVTFRSPLNVTSVGSGSYGQQTGYLNNETNRDTPDMTNSNQNMTAWDRTLYKLSEKLIDVSTLQMRPSAYESTEVKEKEARYKKLIKENEKQLIDAIEDIKKSLKFTSLKKPSDALTNPDLLKPIDSDDLNAINSFSRQAALAHQQVYTINISEDIVVPFPSV